MLKYSFERIFGDIQLSDKYQERLNQGNQSG